MIFAIDNFVHLQNELPEFKLKLLLNIEDFNYPVFIKVFNILKSYQQQQFNAYKISSEAHAYREERNARLPHIDFKNLPGVFDNALLEKIIEHQKEGEIRCAIYDLLTEEHKSQITQWEHELREEREEKRPAALTEEERKREDETIERRPDHPNTGFSGNMGEPDTVTSYILRYGINPITHSPETIESFYAKYTIDPKTGDPVPKNEEE